MRGIDLIDFMVANQTLQDFVARARGSGRLHLMQQSGSVRACELIFPSAFFRYHYSGIIGFRLIRLRMALANVQHFVGWRTLEGHHLRGSPRRSLGSPADSAAGPEVVGARGVADAHE